MNLKLLLALLSSFFRVRADDPPEDTPADPDPQPELNLDPADPEPAPHDDPALASAEELRASREETRRAKEDSERYQRELADARRHTPQRQDEETAREEAILADPNADKLHKWQIQANRELRAGRSTAQAALLQAQDVNDRTAFSSVAMTDPVAKKYEVRVEKELSEMRSKGQNAPREAIYTYLLGKDMREGKFKKKTAPASEPSRVNRGKLPGARSDVSARSGMSEHEKRRARLENVSI